MLNTAANVSSMLEESNLSNEQHEWAKLADQQSVSRTIKALKANGIDAQFVKTSEKAKAKVLEMIPDGAEVMTMTSVTLDTLGISAEINDSGKYNAVRPKLYSLNRETQALEMKKLGAAPQYAVGSANVVTEDGRVVFASNTGSQLGAYAYGSLNVILVVGAQKIVKNLNEAMERINNYVLNLESDRLKKLFGVPSNVSKLLIIDREVKPGRIKMIIVGQELGF